MARGFNVQTTTGSQFLRDPLVRALLTLLVIIAALTLIQMLWSFVVQFQDLIMLFVLAWIISFLLEPAVARLSRIMSRMTAILVVYLVLLLAMGGGLFLLVPGLISQSEAAAQQAPLLADKLYGLVAGASGLLAAQGISTADFTGQLLEPVKAVGPLLFANAVTLATEMASILFQLVIIIVLSLYLMIDGEHLGGRLAEAIPARYRHDFAFFVGSIYRAFGGFLRGQIIQSIVYGVGIALIMILTGLGPYATLVSVVAALSIFIPFLGPLLGTIPPIVIALTVGDVGRALLVGILTVVLNLVVINVLAPKVLSQAIGLNPILVLGAVLVGARLGGPWGALFGVPVAAVMSAMLSFYQLSVAEREQRLKEVVGTNDGLPSTMPSDSSVAPETEPSTGMP